MGDKTYKNILDDGCTTYHEDGSKSTTYKNIFSDGYTTYHEDGSKSTTHKNIFSDGYTTYHEDGSKSTTHKSIFSEGYTTYHEDGSKSTTHKNFFSDGYTTYNYESESSTRYVDQGEDYKSMDYLAANSAGYTSDTSVAPKPLTSFDVFCLMGGTVVAAALAYLYSSYSSLMYFVVLVISLVLSMSRYDKYYMSRFNKTGEKTMSVTSWTMWNGIITCMLFFLIINNKVNPSSGLMYILFLIIPIAIGFLFCFIGPKSTHSEEVFAVPFIMMIMLFSRIYAENYRFIFTYITIALFIVLFIMSVIAIIKGIKYDKVSLIMAPIVLACGYLIIDSVIGFGVIYEVCNEVLARLSS